MQQDTPFDLKFKANSLILSKAGKSVLVLEQLTLILPGLHFAWLGKVRVHLAKKASLLKLQLSLQSCNGLQFAICGPVACNTTNSNAGDNDTTGRAWSKALFGVILSPRLTHHEWK